MRVIGYIRVSTDEQMKGSSLETQESAIRKYCEEQGHKLVQVFSDHISAKTPDRPQLNALVRFCSVQVNQINLLIVNDFDRFSRNAGGHAAVRAMLKKYGVGLYSIRQPLGDTSADRFIETVFSGLAELDNDMRAERVVSGMQKALEIGRWMWAAPLGYKRNKPKQSPSLIIVDEEAQHIKYAFEQVARGKTKSQILTDLKRRGLRSRSGKPFTKQSLNGMLMNPLYAGVINKMGIVSEGDFEPIISRDLFDSINSKKSTQRGVSHPRLHADFPLRRFVKCVSCRGSLTGSWSTGRGGKKYGHYRCENKACRTVKISKQKLDSLFECELCALSVRPQTLDLLEAVAEDMWSERTAEEAKARKELQRRIEVLVEKKDRLVDAYVQERMIDGETYERLKQSYDREIDEARLLIPRESISRDQLTQTIVRSKAFLTDLRQTWNRLEVQQKVAFQQLIYPDGLTCNGEQLGIIKKSWLFIDFMDENNQKSVVVRPPGLEPGTCRLRVCCSAN